MSEYETGPYTKSGFYNVEVIISESKTEQTIEVWRVEVRGLNHRWDRIIDRFAKKIIPLTPNKK